MKIFRAKDIQLNLLKFEKSFTHNTALIAEDENTTLGIIEYEIKSFDEAEIINFETFTNLDESNLINGFLEEISYWNPSIKRVSCDTNNTFISSETLLNSNFKRNLKYYFEFKNYKEVHKVDLSEIVVEQLTVDENKLLRASSWIKTPEDIVVSCVKIDGKIICIDGYSRLLTAFRNDFKYVYATFESEFDLKFYTTCLDWCKQENILSLADLNTRVVSEKEHLEIWVKKCQEYFKNRENRK